VDNNAKTLISLRQAVALTDYSGQFHSFQAAEYPCAQSQGTVTPHIRHHPRMLTRPDTMRPRPSVLRYVPSNARSPLNLPLTPEAEARRQWLK